MTIPSILATTIPYWRVRNFEKVTCSVAKNETNLCQRPNCVQVYINANNRTYLLRRCFIFKIRIIFFSTFWGHYKLHVKRWSWTCWPLRRFLLFSIKRITKVSNNSHAVGVWYCQSCRYGRCAAIVVFFTMLQNFVSFSFWLSFGKAEPSLSQILSGSVKDWCKEDRTDVGRATAMATAWELTKLLRAFSLYVIIIYNIV